ncbi:MAG: YhcH/YjgK/YiaL family protein [Spirochaetes bacterium]|jgi:YhcH/YjgK/YiaL family protein|nr:YhcH/YjgK/YiaL family protein [Spirochaetota bacterium]
MIIDTVANIALYAALNSKLGRALDYITKTDLGTLPAGRTDIDGADIYCIVSEYDTRPAGELKWEAHRVYTDIQVVLSGAEAIGYAPVSALNVTAGYDAGSDVMFLEGEGTFMPALPGRFIVLTPHDAHMPGVSTGVKSRIKKLVIKVRYSAPL